MSGIDHLARAKEYIAKGEEYYAKAADEIIAAQKEDPTLSFREIDKRVGKSESRNGKWSSELVQWRTSARGQAQPTPYTGIEAGDERNARGATRVLADPEQRRQVIAALPSEQIEEVIQEANEIAVERARAERAEHQTESTTRDLMGGDKFDPAEYWADTLVIRVNRNARELASLIKRAGGLLFGTMPPEEAFDYLHEAERLLAEARAAAQEQVRDRAEV